MSNALKALPLLLLLAAAGCEQTSDSVIGVQARPVEKAIRYELTGSVSPNSEADGQVYEYH